MCRTSRSKQRSQKGNMLIFVTLAMTFLTVGLVMTASYGGVYFTQSRLQSSADEIAMAGARKLNEFNRLGQMNDMVARCRQLVYASSKQMSEVEQNHNDPLMEKLTRQLDDEAIESAQSLDSERRKLAATARAESREAMQQKFTQVKNSYQVALPWLTIAAPGLVSNDTGSVNGMQSNAQELEGFPELSQGDKGNLINGKPTSLYRAENDARLPIANSPSFKFSPLPPAVGNEMAPARATLPGEFKTISSDYAPCSARAALQVRVSSGLGPAASANLQAMSTAVASGGGLWQ